MICIFLKSNDYFSYIYVVVGLSFHMAHPVISDLNRDSSKCLTRRILRRICKGLGGFGCGTRGTTLAPASIELFYCYPEKTGQIIINIYLEKQTQAVNLNSGRGWDEEPMAMAMGLLVIEKQIVCVHCRVHRDSSGGRQKWNTCPLNIHTYMLVLDPVPSNPFLKTKSETIRCVQVGKTKLTSLCSHFYNIKLQYVVY